MIYHLIKIQKLSAGIFLILQQGIRVLKSPYINKSFFSSAGGWDFWEKQKSIFQSKKQPFEGCRTKKKKRKEGKFSSFSIFIRTKPNPNQKKSFFFFFFSFENSNLSLTRVWNLNFQDKITIKRWTPSEGKSILHQHLFLLLFFIIYYFLLFCLISYLIQFIFIFVLIIY